MKYTQVKNPIWANAEHTAINCDVDFDDLQEEFVPFTADPTDPYNPASKEIFDDCVLGKYGQVGEYVPYVPSAEANKQQAVQLLQQTDWTTISDVADPALSNPYLMNQSDFFAYRSSLRAIAVNPIEGNLDWPVKPQEQWSS